jgi:predicted transcriptional regulator
MIADSFYFDIKAESSAVFLGRTEAELMELAWSHSQLTVKSALFYLGHRDKRAYTTVMTVLGRLAKKGLLERSRDGRNYVYRVAVDRESFLKQKVLEVLNCLQTNFPETLEAPTR